METKNIFRENRPAVPQFRESLFWDTKQENIDWEKNAKYVIERIFEHGSDKEVHWLWNTYTKEAMSEVLEKSRDLRPRTRALWESVVAS